MKLDAPLLEKASLVLRSSFLGDPREVCPWLLGKIMIRRQTGSLLAGRIVEVEAYLGAEDAAAHAAAGLTTRNSVLFGPPGHAYVYFIYGAHYCFNISCMPEGESGCVLVRALEPLAGVESMAEARGLPAWNTATTRKPRSVSSGPGRLCQALGITRERDNGKDLLAPGSDLQVRDDGFTPAKVAVTPRIGIT